MKFAIRIFLCTEANESANHIISIIKCHGRNIPTKVFLMEPLVIPFKTFNSTN